MHNKHNILWRETKANWRKCYHGASFFILALPKNNCACAFTVELCFCCCIERESEVAMWKAFILSWSGVGWDRVERGETESGEWKCSVCTKCTKACLWCSDLVFYVLSLSLSLTHSLSGVQHIICLSNSSRSSSCTAYIPIISENLSRNIPRNVHIFFATLLLLSWRGKAHFHVCMLSQFQWQFVFNVARRKKRRLSSEGEAFSFYFIVFWNGISCKAQLFYYGDEGSWGVGEAESLSLVI